MAEVLSPAANALLEAIAKSESAGAWNVIYGGSKFDSYDDHPRKYVKIKSGPNKGKFSSAAGKYQILASTYDDVAPMLGITDFSPESQRQIAWYLAQDAYGPNLERDLLSGDPTTIAAIGKKLKGVWTSLPGGIEQGQTAAKFINNYTRALETREGMKVPGMLGDDPPRILEGIKDREAARLGYGEIAPNPLTRPNYFNETGAPPVPLNRPPPPPSLAERTGVQPLNPSMSPALQAARARLDTARQARAGVQTPEALAVTPRLTQTNGEVDGIVDTRPGLDWDEFKPGMTAGGAGSLFDERINPAAANPAKPAVKDLRLPVSPPPSQSFAGQDRGQPHTAAAPAPQRTVNTNATAVPANRQPQYATTATGKQVELGKSYILGDKLKIAELGKDGKAVFRDVEEYRDDFLRKNVDQNAPLVFDKGAAGSVARAIAAPMVKQGLASAGEAAKDALGNVATGVVDTVTGAAKQAGNVLSSFLNSSSSNDNAPRPQSYAGQERITPSIVKPANTLTIKPSVPQTYAGQEATRPKTTTKSIVNPAYAEWEAKYGDGSQVQTAATGAPITKNQLAAIQSMNGVTLPPAPSPAAPPPAPPKMITVTIPAPVAPVVVNALPPAASPSGGGGNTLRPATFKGTSTGQTYVAGQRYQNGDRIIEVQADGSFKDIKTGKVNPGASNTLSTRKLSPSESRSTDMLGDRDMRQTRKAGPGRP